MGFWSAEINPETGLPFKTKEEFYGRVSRLTSGYSPVIDALVAGLESKFPSMNRDKMKRWVAETMATMGDPPKNLEEAKVWARTKFAPAMQRQHQQRADARLREMGIIDERGLRREGVSEQEEMTARANLDQEFAAVFGDVGTRSGGGGYTVGDAFDPSTFSLEMGGAVQSAEDADPGSISGNKPGDDYAKRLQEFKDALFNPQVAQRLAGMAASQSERASYGAGIRGGAQTQGINQAVADAGIQYDQNVNSQALQYMGVENARVANAEQASLMRAQFNAQQQALAAGQRQQMGGTVGGIIGGVVGSLPALFPGGQGVAAITAPALSGIGAGIGSAAASSPGFGSYGGGNRRSGSGGSNGISGA